MNIIRRGCRFRTSFLQFLGIAAFLCANVPANAAIRVTDFSPASGPVGTAVTLTGQGFDAVAENNFVFFSGLRANVTAATETSLTVAVPAGAIYGPITAIAHGLSAQSRLAFDVTFPTRPLNASAFDSPALFNAGHGPGQTRIADLDGDGRPDLTVAHQYGIAVYRNNGTGGVAGVFSPKADYPVGEITFDLHLADFDGDGRLDMVAVNFIESTVSVFRNLSTNGAISFAPKIDFAVNDGPHNAAVADLDGDGRPEIITTGFGQTTLAVLKNITGTNGIGFAPHVPFSAGTEAHGVGVQDLDGDGRPDVVVAHHTAGSPGVMVLRNVGEPGVIDGNTLQLAAQLPANGTFVVFGDFDMDGRPDIVTSSWFSKSVTIFQNLTSPASFTNDSFGPPVVLPSAGSTKRVAVADLDGDGRVELAFPTELGDSLGFYRNVGNTNSFDASWFSPRVDLASGWNGDGISIGDINLDGLPDIVFVAQYVDQVRIYKGVRTSAPQILAQPASITVGLDGNAALSVNATGGGLSYSWYRNSNLLQNATGPTLYFAHARLADAGNYFVIVENSMGRATSDVAVVTVVVSRTLALGTVPNVNEGDLVSVPLTLISDGGVGGMGFGISYPLNALSAPEIVWDNSLAGALTDNSVSKRGGLDCVFALPATSLPPGTQTLATIQFRARTVQSNLVIALQPNVTDVSDAAGNPINGGTVAEGISFAVLNTGSLAGDNNGNHQLDIGDASLLMRLVAKLDSVRPWDLVGNDFNANLNLDSGDVIKLLRILAGIDPQPQAMLSVSASGRKGNHSVNALSEAASMSPSRQQSEPGQLVTWKVRLDSLSTPISGAALTLDYPTNALRLVNAQSHRVGTSVPAGVVTVWNVAPAQTNYAAQNGRVMLALSGTTGWPASNTVLAEFTFEVQGGATNQHLWPLSVSALEVSGNGFNTRTLGSFNASFVGRNAAAGALTRLSVPRDGSVSFRFNGESGASYRIDFSDDLMQWHPLREILNVSGPSQITDPDTTARPQRFYRCVTLP